MLFSKKIIFPLMAAIISSMPLAASAQEVPLGETNTYRMQDGSKVTVDKKAMAVYMKAKAKELGTPVNTLSNEEWDKVALDVSKLTPEELQELYNDLESGIAFENLTADEMEALRDSYNETTWDGNDPSEEGGDSISIEERESHGNIALAGILGGAGLAAGAGAYARRKGRGFSLFSSNVDPETEDVSGSFGSDAVSDRKAVDVISNCIAETNGSTQTESTSLASTIFNSAKKYGLDPFLITCQLKQESGFSADAVSPVGACGIAQFMPSTADSLGVNPWDVESSIDGQCRYMKNLLSSFGDYSLALAGYNAGGGAVEEYGGIPPYSETQNYVATIMPMVGNLKVQYAEA